MFITANMKNEEITIDPQNQNLGFQRKIIYGESSPRVRYLPYWSSRQEFLKDPILDPHHLFSILALGGHYS